LPDTYHAAVSGGDRHLNFYGNRDNLLRLASARLWWSRLVMKRLLGEQEVNARAGEGVEHLVPTV
jgi:hypothetical protein